MRKFFGAVVLVIAGMILSTAVMFAAINFQALTPATADMDWLKFGMIGGAAAVAIVVTVVGSLIWGGGAWRHHFGHVFIWSAIGGAFSILSFYVMTLDPKTRQIMEQSQKPGDPPLTEMFTDMTALAIMTVALIVIGGLLLASARRSTA